MSSPVSDSECSKARCSGPVPMTAWLTELSSCGGSAAMSDREPVVRISHKGQNAKPNARKLGGTGTGGPENTEHFTGANQNAKLVRAIANLVRRARLDYEGFPPLSAHVRKGLGLRRPPRSRRLPQVLPETSLKQFFDAIRQGGNLQHEIMLKLLFYTAIRVSELVSIRVEQVDLDSCKIFIEQGKGAKD